MDKIVEVMDKAIKDLKKLRIGDVSGTSKDLILTLLNNHLKYGENLLVNCDDDDEQGQIEIWRAEKEVKDAINEIESCH